MAITLCKLLYIEAKDLTSYYKYLSLQVVTSSGTKILQIILYPSEDRQKEIIIFINLFKSSSFRKYRSCT
eukprot:snap_masked-scaffold_24-processed-gene-5.0-mRNA-1 protein AED:1.00 eAED:1.00 QI:0/0/0/0/1/1/2/0/69